MAATLTISWSKPTSLASCTDCSFEYKYAISSVSLDGVTPIAASFGTLSATITGLVNGASYNYAVRTICGPVQSKWSYGTTVVCDTPPVDTPTPTPTQTAGPGQPTATPTPTPTPTATVGECATPTFNSVTLNSGSVFNANFTPTANCNAIQVESSSDQITWTSNTSGCSSPIQKSVSSATGTWYFRIKQFCVSGGPSSYSNVLSYTYSTSPTPTPTPTPTANSNAITNCVKLVKSTATSGPDCASDSVQRHTVTLYDSTGGTEVMATSDVTVIYNGTESGVSTTYTFIIPAGQSSTYEDIYVREYTGTCGVKGGVIFRNVTTVSSITPSYVGTCTIVTPTPGVTLYNFYRAGEVASDSYAETYCSVAGYTIVSPVYSTKGFSDLSIGDIVYTDVDFTPLAGLGFFYRIAIANTSDTNTKDTLFTWISTNANGEILNIGTYSCTSGTEAVK